MAYVEQPWVNDDPATPLSAPRMLHIEAGIGAASGVADNVRAYGAAPGGSAVTNTAAIQAAINAVATVGGVVFIPAGTYLVNELTLSSVVVLAGAGRDRTVLSYAGTGSAITNSTPGTRRYDWHVRDLTLATTTGAIGLDMDSISTSRFDNLKINGFSDSGVYVHSDISGGAVYNRFFNIHATNCGTGFKLRGVSSNANIWFGCRANICGWCWDLQDSNDNTLDGCQAESSTNAIKIDSTILGGSRWHRIRNTRIENCTTGITIGANVEDTVVDGLWWDGSTPTIWTDSGIRTHRANDLFAVSSANVITVPTGHTIVGAAGLALGSTTAALQANTGTPLYLRGNAANTAAAVGAWIGNGTTLSTAGGRVAGFCKDTPVAHAQPVSYVNIDGSYEFANGIKVMTGTGTPEAAVTAPVGSLYTRSDGGAGTTLYTKTSGTGNTGWTAVT